LHKRKSNVEKREALRASWTPERRRAQALRTPDLLRLGRAIRHQQQHQAKLRRMGRWDAMRGVPLW